MNYRSLVVLAVTLILAVFIGSGTFLKPVAAQSGRKPASTTSSDTKKKDLETPDKTPDTQSGKPAQTDQSGTQGPAGGLSGRPPLKKKVDAGPATDQEVVTLGTNVVGVPVVVYDKKGNVLTGLKKENFKVFEDGVEQKVTNFSPIEAPITTVVLLEFSKLTDRLGGNMFEYGRAEVLRPTLYFVQSFVQPKDYISIVAYDIRPTPITDFTSDKAKLMSAVSLLFNNAPAFSEANLFDSIKFVLKGGKGDAEVLGKNSDKQYEDYTGLEEVEGRTSVLLICSGIDTFSKINLGDAYKIVKNAGVPIYIIGTGNLFFKKNDQYMSATSRLTMLQAENTLKTFANDSGGHYYPVTFEGELPSALNAITAMMRNEYSLGYEPTNTRAEGKERKIDVHVFLEGVDKTKELTVQSRHSYVEPKTPKDKAKKK